MQVAAKTIRARALTPAASFGVGAVLLPDRWVAAAEAAMKKSGSSQAQIFDDALKFHRFWANRDMPDMDLPEASPVRGRVFVSENGVKYKNSLRYGEREALAYLVSQAPHTYASTLRVLNELKIRDPSFQPTSVLDYGAGSGSSTWAVHDTWGEDIESITCVDTSLPMLNLTQHMLSDMEYSRHKRFQQFLSPKGDHDLVVAAHTLSELPSGDARRSALTSLWNKTTSYLVLVENGSAWGHMCMLEARSHIAALALRDNHHFLQEIHSSDHGQAEQEEEGEERGMPGHTAIAGADEEHGFDSTPERGWTASDSNKTAAAAAQEEDEATWMPAEHDHPYTAHVVAPCPHMRTCPLTKTSRPCHFPANVVWPPSLMYHEAFRRRQARRVKFAYMILKKQRHNDLAAYSNHVLQCASAYADGNDGDADARQQSRDHSGGDAGDEEDDTLAAIAAHAGTTALHQHLVSSSFPRPGAMSSASKDADGAGSMAIPSDPLQAYEGVDGPIMLTQQGQDEDADAGGVSARSSSSSSSNFGHEQDAEPQLDEQQQKQQHTEQRAAGEQLTSNAGATSKGEASVTLADRADTRAHSPESGDGVTGSQHQGAGTHLHRVIRLPKRKKGLVALQTCAPDGKIRDVVVSKRRVKNDSRWRGAKKLVWGDVLYL